MDLTFTRFVLVFQDYLSAFFFFFCFKCLTSKPVSARLRGDLSHTVVMDTRLPPPPPFSLSKPPTNSLPLSLSPANPSLRVSLNFLLTSVIVFINRRYANLKTPPRKAYLNLTTCTYKHNEKQQLICCLLSH